MFLIFFPQNIDCGYTLESPRQGTLAHPSFTMLRVEIKGYSIHGHVCVMGISQQAHDVKMTSYQRRCDVMTSHRL